MISAWDCESDEYKEVFDTNFLKSTGFLAEFSGDATRTPSTKIFFFSGYKWSSPFSSPWTAPWILCRSSHIWYVERMQNVPPMTMRLICKKSLDMRKNQTFHRNFLRMFKLYFSTIFPAFSGFPLQTYCLTTNFLAGNSPGLGFQAWLQHASNDNDAWTHWAQNCWMFGSPTLTLQRLNHWLCGDTGVS